MVTPSRPAHELPISVGDSPQPVPRHIAVLPDGNRRWARAHGLPLARAVERSTDRVLALVRWCQEAGIEVLSGWSSSPDNLAKRDPDELEMILRQTTETVGLVAATRLARIRPIGDLDMLPRYLSDQLRAAARETADIDGMTMNIGAAYNGRQDLLRAMRACLTDGITPGRLTEQDIESRLSTSGQPPVDLLVRTSGEHRLSGFMPWQTADCELYFTSTLWQDFTREDFDRALADYAARDRRHGA
ncbi:di-trans,poly-cis-decaprenylcistransferase [Streptomyces sp. IMTB 2501]|uniref:polyprenyl diphosphate synthase n=1 Tax=Streptomyces sp. IMTB 2501 TaxID=1776340 RepID=UPI00096E4ACE|nr:polyprenyl diphosphate synthase [Streptomyces sp. IMTB 2501]OLZ59232.1 di-trans,poly-cis-decaprenylcistransferase [Streptomyces sp. IMTB 2501]